ncbi:MAG TPA: hypothetical protein VK846_05715 [Candidatus Limnocylindria bacterium]|nr:hypothetical protein [Candidatus Limnocylindria bacterium]
MTNDEFQMTKEIQNQKPRAEFDKETVAAHYFVIRHSSFAI